jgi:serine/threonine protein kinase
MRVDLRVPFGIPLEITLAQGQVSIPREILPKEHITGEIKVGGQRRCHLTYKEITHRGGYGIIQKVVRTAGDGEKTLCVKRPDLSSFSLCGEAIVQWLAQRTLEDAGIRNAIPSIYDIYQYVGETRFTMDFIEGVNAVDSILTAPDPTARMLSILTQAALILGILEERLGLDHRDLKADNLWVREAPVEYTVILGDTTWSFRDTHQVVLLDFGFACIGDRSGTAVVNLSDGVLPAIDPCPKEGRDLFQLIVSLWSVPAIRSVIRPQLAEQVVQWLRFRGATYDKLVETARESRWSYLAVSDRQFRHPPLHPRSILEKLRGLSAGLSRYGE